MFQSVDPEIKETFDNEDWVMEAMEAQGFILDDGIFSIPENGDVSMRIPSSLMPSAPDGSPVTMNLRSDDTFVEDEGWHKAAEAYTTYLAEHEGKHVLFLELGVGGNTPVIIKYPFWRMTFDNKKAVYACINHSEAFCPKEIEDRSICIDGDIAEIFEELR